MYVCMYVCLCVCVLSCRSSAKVVSDREMQRKASHNEGWLVGCGLSDAASLPS